MWLYINTAPQTNAKKDGNIFYTVMVGVSKDALAVKTGKPAEELKNVKLTMEIFPEKVEVISKAFAAATAADSKLVIRCEDFTVAPLRENTFPKDGETVNGFQASIWPAKGWTLDVKEKTQKVQISDELRKMLGDID